jgi:predicted dehydrogenase
MQAAKDSGLAEIISFADTSEECIKAASAIVPDGKIYRQLQDVIMDPFIDAVVIATPSAFHMEQSINAFQQGKSVFCQKPLGRNADEVSKLILASKKANKLLGADFSYRYTKAFKVIHQIIQSGELGKIFAVDLKFHNAYGPDKPWFYDHKLSGGGCVLDLGIHLIDLVLYALDFPHVLNVDSLLYAQGISCKGKNKVEDYAQVQLALDKDIAVHLACSWNLKVGRDAVIEAAFYGTKGGVAMKNINGSFYDFQALKYNGTKTEVLFDQPDDWGGKAIVEWIKKLSVDSTWDPTAAQYLSSAEVVDLIYEI